MLNVRNYAGGLDFGLSLHLHLYFVYASSKGSGECALTLLIKRSDAEKITFNQGPVQA